MRPSARVQAAIDIVAEVLAGAAADRALQAWGRAHRFAGSGDRRAIASHVYAALRHAAPNDGARAAMITGLVASGVAADTLAELFDGSPHGPAPLAESERTLPASPGAAPPVVPQWLLDSLRRAFGDMAETELQALMQRAPLDLRANTLKATRGEVAERLAQEGIIAEPLPLPPTALSILAGSVDVESSDAFADGLVEIQDAGSQLAAALADARPGMAVLDLCAGAGGKTLSLAAQMENRGRLLATDTGTVRLRRLGPRAARAGATIVETRLLAEDWLSGPSPFAGETFDRIVVDAPCSGSGTWRRNPETRLRLTEASLAALTRQQTALLDAAAPLVAPGGRLVFITCSVLPQEGDDIAAAFLANHPDFTALPIASLYAQLFGYPLSANRGEPWLRLSPARDGTDGFFIALFTRTG